MARSSEPVHSLTRTGVLARPMFEWITITMSVMTKARLLQRIERAVRGAHGGGRLAAACEEQEYPGVLPGADLHVDGAIERVVAELGRVVSRQKLHHRGRSIGSAQVDPSGRINPVSRAVHKTGHAHEIELAPAPDGGKVALAGRAATVQRQRSLIVRGRNDRSGRGDRLRRLSWLEVGSERGRRLRL